MDLLLETEKLEWLVQHVDAKNYGRTCLYLVSCCAYLPEGDDKAVLQTAYDIYSKQGQEADALRIALKMNDTVRSPLDCFSVPGRAHRPLLI